MEGDSPEEFFGHPINSRGCVSTPFSIYGGTFYYPTDGTPGVLCEGFSETLKDNPAQVLYLIKSDALALLLLNEGTSSTQIKSALLGARSDPGAVVENLLGLCRLI